MRAFYSPNLKDDLSKDKRSRQVWFPLAFFFVLGSTAAIVVPSGPLTLLFVAGILAVPVSFAVLRESRAKPLRTLFFIWFAVIASSALIHGNVFKETLGQGLYPAAILVVTLLFVKLIGENQRWATWYALAGAGGIALGVLLQPIGIGENQAAIKSGYGVAAVIAVLALLSIFAVQKWVVIVVSLLLGAWLIAQDFRSSAIIAGATGLIVLLSSVRRRVSRASIMRLIVICSLLTLAGTFAYLSAANSGALGVDAQARYQLQTSGTAGLLVGGRPEIIASFVAIRADPLLGRGGSPEFTAAEKMEALQALNRSGIMLGPQNVARILGGGVNSHSLLFSSWVTNGIAGIIPWVLLSFAYWRGAFFALVARSPMYPMMVFGALQFSWDVLFSPWSPRNEVWLGLLLAMALIAHTAANQQQETLKRQPLKLGPASPHRPGHLAGGQHSKSEKIQRKKGSGAQ